MQDRFSSSSFDPAYDVIIAGAGPVGLLLACELRLAKLSALILEQHKDLSSPLKRLPFGMRGLSVPTLEAFYRRGLLEDLTDNSEGSRSPPTEARQKQHSRRPAGHFAGIQFFSDRIETSQWQHRLPGQAVNTLATDMERVEAVLTARAMSLGVPIKRGVGVESVEQSNDGVTVLAAGETFRARWLIGCDGGRSTVRKLGGFEFVGTEPEFTGYSVEVELADGDKPPAGRHYTPTGMYTYQEPGTIAMVDFDGGAYHRAQPISLEHVQKVLRRVTGSTITVSALKLATTWTDRAFHATNYRRGRLLLAGDAAHIHSPLGGQGLNLGLGDAMNLGWKLAATVRGDAPPGLLDTYSSERHSVADKVLDWSRAQVAIMRPSRSSRALEAILRDLIDTRDGATYFAERVWGVSLHYELSAIHPLVGRSAPDFKLLDGTTLGGLLRTGRGLLLDFESRITLQALVSCWSGRVTYVAGDAVDRMGLSALLVRPTASLRGRASIPSMSKQSQKRRGVGLENPR